MRIDGSATPTTRLSSAVMKRAIETIARVQPRRGEEVMACVLSWLCDRSLTDSGKKRGSAAVLRRAEQDVRPVGVGVLGAHRGEHVEQHAVREERADLVGRRTGLALDELDEAGEAAPHLGA